jgi:hypothetical protein
VDFSFFSHATQGILFLVSAGRVDGAQMPIRHLLEAEPTVFKSDDVAIIVQAFERVLQKKRLVDRDDPVVLMIAELTIEAARKGERDPVRLSQTVLSRMSL